MLGRKSDETTSTGGATAATSSTERSDTVHAQRQPQATAGSGSVAAEQGQRSGHAEAKERFGGTNWGAGFFGWLVAIGITVLLMSIVGAIVAAVGSNVSVSQSDAQRQAGTIGVAAGITLLVVLAIAYFTGGYVAGRMSRFDGARQGLAVWIIGLVVTLAALALGALFGAEYNIFDRVDMPRLPVSTDQLSWGGLITAAALLIVTLLAAVIGGKVGHRYHNKVDKVAHR